MSIDIITALNTFVSDEIQFDNFEIIKILYIMYEAIFQYNKTRDAHKAFTTKILNLLSYFNINVIHIGIDHRKYISLIEANLISVE